jgi:hypothetical protein
MKIFLPFLFLVSIFLVLSVYCSTVGEVELADGEADLSDVIISNPIPTESNKAGLGETFSQNDVPKTPGSVQSECSADYATYKQNLYNSRMRFFFKIFIIFSIALVVIGVPLFLIFYIWKI